MDEKRSELRDLEKRVGYRFKRRALLEKALTHRSYRFEKPGVEVDNERLEFLGDALLGFLAADRVFNDFPDWPEGDLTALRSRLTNGKALAEHAREIDLGAYLSMGQGEVRTGGRSRSSNLANAMEALLGAVFLDGGMRAATRVFEAIFAPRLDGMEHDRWADNPKGCLQELVQAEWKTSPAYRMLETRGPAHARVFKIEVELPDGRKAIGEGASKQSAEREAAARMLETIHAAADEEESAR